jgi:hypothetical protein
MFVNLVYSTIELDFFITFVGRGCNNFENEACNFESKEADFEVDFTFPLLANYFSSDSFSLLIPDNKLFVKRNFDPNNLFIIVRWVKDDDLGCFIPLQLTCALS